MLQYFTEFVLLPLLVSVVAELIVEWLIRKWQNKCDNQSLIFPFTTSTTEKIQWRFSAYRLSLKKVVVGNFVPILFPTSNPPLDCLNSLCQ
ncbi:TPA: hypothetical protein ACGO92_001627 [Streptococcus suis]